MTPGARVAAAAAVLDEVLGGARAEVALTRWARGSRFAGSKDRAAVRDLVFDALRCRRSYAWLGGAETGRGLMIGGLRGANVQPESLLTGEGYALKPPTPAEAGRSLEDAPLAVRGDMPDWLAQRIVQQYAEDAEQVMAALRTRAPVFLRVNLMRGTRQDAVEALAEDGIVAEPHSDVKTALRVIENERKIRNSQALIGGLVELQDASSQAAVLSLAVTQGMRVLDYCAGGGGKGLALADAGAIVTAHDAIEGRMRDLPARAARAGVEITVRTGAELANDALFDLVLVDAPCSGSGTWRRDPDGKWRLTEAELTERVALQREILAQASGYVAPGGVLAYATCSLLAEENAAQVIAFVNSRPEWAARDERLWRPSEAGDGFFLAQFTRV